MEVITSSPLRMRETHPMWLCPWMSLGGWGRFDSQVLTAVVGLWAVVECKANKDLLDDFSIGWILGGFNMLQYASAQKCMIIELFRFLIIPFVPILLQLGAVGLWQIQLEMLEKGCGIAKLSTSHHSPNWLVWLAQAVLGLYPSQRTGFWEWPKKGRSAPRESQGPGCWFLRWQGAIVGPCLCPRPRLCHSQGAGNYSGQVRARHSRHRKSSDPEKNVPHAAWRWNRKEAIAALITSNYQVWGENHLPPLPLLSQQTYFQGQFFQRLWILLMLKCICQTATCRRQLYQCLVDIEWYWDLWMIPSAHPQENTTLSWDV